MLRSGAPVTREPPSADASDAKTIRIESRVRGRSLLLLVLLTLQLFHAVESQTVRHAEKESVKPKFVLSDIDTTCPTGWERQDASCYRLYSMERSWPQALAFCSRFGAVLARIESQRQNAFVSKMLAKPQRSASASAKMDFWIGLLSQQNGDGDARFVWSNGEYASRYVGFWTKNQPDHRSGSCTKASLDQANNLAWRLEMCNLLLPFICELSACVKGQFFCHNGAGCVPEKFHCNGVDDCGDASDELNCPASHSELACLRHDRGESGRIESPNFPSAYRPNANCRWVIEGPINSRIQLSFDAFETEEHQDVVTVLDGGPSENASIVMAHLSGTPAVPDDRLTFTSSTNMLVVRFRSDASIQARGFQANWKAVTYTCGGTLKAQALAQTFSSPEFPRPYPNGMECAWTIEAPPGELITLNIEDFELEPQHDFLIVHDGALPSSPILARLSDDGAPANAASVNTVAGGPRRYYAAPIVSTQSRVLIYFLSDARTARRGFSIAYRKGCQSMIRAASGTIVSPGFLHLPLPPAQLCRFTVELLEAPMAGVDEQSITLAFNNFDVSANDRLQIFEGGESGRPLHESGGFSDVTRPPKTIYAKQGKVDLLFRTSGLTPSPASSAAAANTALGWNITFSTNCPPLIVPRSVVVSTRNTAYGTKVTVSCARGFEFVTGRGRFFDVTCELAGRWSESVTLPDCQPVYCSPVPQIANGFAVSATNVSYGGMARYACYDGFSFSTGKKSEEVFCTDEGRWTATPHCRAQTCAALPHFVNGARALRYGDGIGYGSVYAFECEAGFRREGAAKILCQPNGEWSSPQPVCKRLSCSDIPSIANGRLVFGTAAAMLSANASATSSSSFSSSPPVLYYGDVARVECDSGFRSVGADSIRCMANRTLDGRPQCADVDECAERTANCAPKTAQCVNVDGGYYCRCLSGFRPQMSCTNSASIAPVGVRTSSGGFVAVSGFGGAFSRAPLSPSAGLSTSTAGAALGAAGVGVLYGRGWCADVDGVPADALSRPPSITYTFAAPKVVEKIRVEKVGAGGAFSTRIRIHYADEVGVPLRLYHNTLQTFPVALSSFGGAASVAQPTVFAAPPDSVQLQSQLTVLISNSNNNGSLSDMAITASAPLDITSMEEAATSENGSTSATPSTESAVAEPATDDYSIIDVGENIASAGSDIFVLARPVEARVLRVELLEWHERPCARIDAIGCQKTSCVDINECEENNGYCEHNCHNLQGSHRCSCEDGYDLFVVDGQAGVRLKDGESGTHQLDTVRFNRSCVARQCAPLEVPDNGMIVSAVAPRFAFPTVVEFACKFGYQMRGPSHLMCLADGTWNGTAPFCIPATCQGVQNNSAIGLFAQPDGVPIGYSQNVTIVCSQQNRPAKPSPLLGYRQCIYDPRPDEGIEYWLSGPEIDCPLVECGPPPALAGAYYELAGGSFASPSSSSSLSSSASFGAGNNNGADEETVGGRHAVGSAHFFHCRAPYVLVGKSSYDDRMVRCNVDGQWDLGDLRCEGPVCPDPGHPADGRTLLNSVEESAVARFACNRPGYRPFPGDAINCTLGTPCVLAEDVGISTGYIPDGAFGDNSDTTIYGYEPHKSRMSSTGWCGSKDAFIFLSVDLQRIYTLTTLRLAGVAGSGHLKGHVTRMQLFHKVQFSQNYDNYVQEFTTPSGNHNKMHQFTLDPPIRARYILLGITEYENNPCLKFDLQGCLAPLSPTHEIPSHLQVGWNASVPQCIDAEPPVFTNCPTQPVVAPLDEHGQLLPVVYTVPEATDNSGIVSHVQVKPADFEPPFPIQHDQDVVYTAFDDAGNSADCVVRLRIPDTQPPVMKCPESYSLWADEGETERHVHFNESTVQQLLVQDMSPVVELRFEPADSVLRVGQHVTVDVSATDAHLNRNKCKFQVAFMPEPCSAWSLPVDERSAVKRCAKTGPTTTVCTAECRDGYRFVDAVSPTTLASTQPSNGTAADGGQPEQATTVAEQRYSCSTVDGGRWSPANTPIACVPSAQEPARYVLRVAMSYVSELPVPAECLKGYELLVADFFNTMDTVLTQRCSSSIQVFVRFLSAEFVNLGPVDAVSTPQQQHPVNGPRRYVVGANYTVQVLPTVLQSVFYRLCGLTLQTIFDLRIPGASAPIRGLLALAADHVTTMAANAGGAGGCPSINATAATTWQGFQCSRGEILRRQPSVAGGPIAVDDFAAAAGTQQLDSLPECLPCPRGSAFVDNQCVQCPTGSYQDAEGQSVCKPCPDGTHTLQIGAQAQNACLPICANGMYSATGMIPCQLCARHSFAGAVPPPPPTDALAAVTASVTGTSGGGYRECEPCPEGTYTARVGAISTNECKPPCKEGHFSATGLEPCSPCPANFYQPSVGQQRCVQCPNNTMSRDVGAVAESQCQPLDCAAFKCHNKGNCAIRNHKEFCECRPGFTGRFCEEAVPICDSHPCLNGGACEPVGGTFRCACPQNFTGSRCQFGPDECVGVNCPNGGVCQDLPGIGTTKCVCRTGFTGDDCSQISDPCQSLKPCQNGADCVPLQLGRYKCKCLPGWDGPNCEQNIDDCADSPCALGAPCRDLLNDFECTCPPGFGGKRCNVKRDLCAEPSACLNGGACVDLLNERKCVCRPGWTGEHCEVNVDECATAPCQNDATCRDQENGFVCECAPGFHGSLCQHMFDHCAVSPCRNNATCVNRGATYSCECRLGFDGVHCEHNVDECATLQRCDAHGTEWCEDCVNDFVCHCRPGYVGELCRTRVNECDLEPCQNNGTCVTTTNGFECECRTGWRGERCEELETQACGGGASSTVDENADDSRPSVSASSSTSSGPCQNDGQCVALVADFFCVCPEGVSGKRCEVAPNRCVGEPCHNGGVCGDFGSRQECTCPRGYRGAGCQYEADTCRASNSNNNSCRNGSRCVPLSDNDELNASGRRAPSGGGGYKCECAPGFTGAECETNIDECAALSSGEPPAFAAGGASGAAAAPCPLAATCVDQVNGFHCRCPFNTTGANCEKRADPDYDLHFYASAGPLVSEAHASRAAQAVPLRVSGARALTLSLWARFAAGSDTAKATALTVYHSELANYASRLSELIRVSGESVRLQLFADFPPLVLRFPANQRLADGNWNNLIVGWTSANGGHYSLVWNAVRLYAESGYGAGRTLDVNAFVTIGDAITEDVVAASSFGPSVAEHGSGGRLVAEQRFVGSVTRVNLWTRALDFEQEIPSIVQRCQGSPEIYDGLVLQFVGYDRLQGKVERVARSTCGRSAGGGATTMTIAREQLRVESCPRDVFVVTPLKEVNVTWPEPIFSAVEPTKMALDRVEHNLKSGQLFTWGEYNALYVAYAANDSSTVECSFKIHVEQEFCPDVADPIHGVQTCESWGPNLRYRACSVRCESGYAFSRPPAVFYTCASDGVWRPRDSPVQHTFRYPQCTKSTPAERIARIQVNYPSLKLCNAAGKSTVREKILQKIYQLNANFTICQSQSNSTCDGIRVSVDCATPNNAESDTVKFLRRHRRALTESGDDGAAAATSASSLFSVRVEIPVKRRPIAVNPKMLLAAAERQPAEHDGAGDAAGGAMPDAVAPVVVGTAGVPKMDVVEAIQLEAMRNGLFNLDQVLPNGKPDLASLHIQSVFHCAVGHVAVGDECVPCAPGSFHNADSGECDLCPAGSYQPDTAETACRPCPTASPVTAGPGAIRAHECKVRCEPGHYVNVERNACEPCGNGFYQPAEAAFGCLACGIGKTTLDATATAEEECRDECPDGEQLTRAGSCQPCAMGTYRSRGVDRQCVPCPAGTTTDGTGAREKAECNTPKCVPGQFLIVLSKQCQLCPRGTYQDEPLQATCKLCPTDYTTAAIGATHESQCYSTNQCKMGEDNCSWKATCIDLPDTDDVPSFRCECNPGYRGNGTYCVDACLNYCLNDGVCRKNRVTGREECVCKENFAGDRCEVRYQPRAQRLTHYVAGVGVVVLLAIIVLLVVSMIVYRAKSGKRELLSLEKPSMLLGMDSSISSNFLYGRPALDRAHSSLALAAGGGMAAPPAAGSSMGTFQRPPVGFYYEDDPAYEQQPNNSGSNNNTNLNNSDARSIFLGNNGNEPTNHQSRGSTDNNADAAMADASRAGANAELNQRLHHIQQHMYKRRGGNNSSARDYSDL